MYLTAVLWCGRGWVMEGPTRGGWGPVNLFARMTRPSDMGVLYDRNQH